MELQKTATILEAVLFAADQPVGLKQMRSLLSEVDPDHVRDALNLLKEEYGDPGNNRGVELVQLAGGYRFRTRAELSPWVRRLYQQAPLRLGRAMLEVLAVIAYRQPVTRAEIDTIRGVDSAGSVKLLMERELVRIVGRKEMPGRPQLYGTTRKFLEVFGLKSLGDLPPLEEELNELQQRLPLTDLANITLVDDDAVGNSGDGDAEADPGAAPDERATDPGPVDVQVDVADQGDDDSGGEPTATPGEPVDETPEPDPVDDGAEPETPGAD